MKQAVLTDLLGKTKKLANQDLRANTCCKGSSPHNALYSDHLLFTRVSHVEEANQQHWPTSSAERMICHMFSLRK
jgi:hypothetical protein